jgi:parallel beta-helix repeat protein
VINGLTFADNASVSESIDMSGSYNTVENCTFIGSNIGTTTAFIFITNSTNDNILNNTCSNLGDDGAASGAAGMGAGDCIVLEASNNSTIQGNTINGAGHSAIELQAYPTNLTVGSNYNQILNNTINQSNGGGGIYLLEESANNTVSNNTISNVGQMVGITQNKAGIDLSGAANNIISNNNIQNYGKSGDCDNDGIYISSYNNSGFNNTNCNNNTIENNTVGQGYGIPIYVREGTGERSAGINVTNNTFTGNTIYLPYQEITCSDYIGSYDPAGYYYVYLGSYTDGAWPTFANGNTFLNNTWVDPNSVGGLIGYYYTGTSTGGFGLSVSSAESNYPSVFSGTVTSASIASAPAAPKNLTAQ